MLDLLQENTDIDPISVEHERKLVEATQYLTINNLLPRASVSQIRDDFSAYVLLDRCLEEHGIKNYMKDI